MKISLAFFHCCFISCLASWWCSDDDDCDDDDDDFIPWLLISKFLICLTGVCLFWRNSLISRRSSTVTWSTEQKRKKTRQLKVWCVLLSEKQQFVSLCILFYFRPFAIFDRNAESTWESRAERGQSVIVGSHETHFISSPNLLFSILFSRFRVLLFNTVYYQKH